MTRSNILLTGAASLVALVAVSGMTLYSFAQSNATDNSNGNPATTKFGRHNQQNLTDAQKAEMQKKLDERKAQIDTERKAIDDAMANGYSAWVEAVKKYRGENAPVLSEVTESNFSKFAEGRKLIEQGRTILDEIGVRDEGFGHGGMGMGKGMGSACLAN
jgi:hypothetical protein